MEGILLIRFAVQYFFFRHNCLKKNQKFNYVRKQYFERKEIHITFLTGKIFIRRRIVHTFILQTNSFHRKKKEIAYSPNVRSVFIIINKVSDLTINIREKEYRVCINFYDK